MCVAEKSNCTYIYIYIYMYTYVYIHTYVNMYIHIHMYMSVYIYTYIHIYGAKNVVISIIPPLLLKNVSGLRSSGCGQRLEDCGGVLSWSFEPCGGFGGPRFGVWASCSLDGDEGVEVRLQGAFRRSGKVRCNGQEACEAGLWVTMGLGLLYVLMNCSIQ